MDTAKEIVSLIKFSPKRENLLGEIKGNLEGPDSEAKGILGWEPNQNSDPLAGNFPSRETCWVKLVN